MKELTKDQIEQFKRIAKETGISVSSQIILYKRGYIVKRMGDIRLDKIEKRLDKIEEWITKEHDKGKEAVVKRVQALEARYDVDIAYRKWRWKQRQKMGWQ